MHVLDKALGVEFLVNDRRDNLVCINCCGGLGNLDIKLGLPTNRIIKCQIDLNEFGQAIGCKNQNREKH